MKICKFELKCKACCSVFGLFFAYLLFLLFGGFMFELIEKDGDEKLKDSKRKHLLDVLARYNISTNNSMINDIIIAAVEARDVNGIILEDITKPVASDWNLGSSVFFSGTIVTTIGYGNITPKTTWGKAFCIIFAIVGIPFTGVLLGKLGLGLTNLIKTADTFIENRIKQCFPKASKEQNMKSHVRSVQLAFVVTMFVLIFLLVPAAVMTKTEENWDFFTAFYFCFVSVSTIGLGDLTPGASEMGITFSNGFQWIIIKNSLQQVSVILYLLFGLAALSIILALVGSMMKSAAEKTFKGGTDLMSGGKAMMGAGGQQIVGGARRFASSFKNKASNAMNILHQSDAEDTDTTNLPVRSPEKSLIAANDKDSDQTGSEERIEMGGVAYPEEGGNPTDYVIENGVACNGNSEYIIPLHHSPGKFKRPDSVASCSKTKSPDRVASAGSRRIAAADNDGEIYSHDKNGIFFALPKSKKRTEDMPSADV